MISHEHRVIFIHIPKTAGTSVEAALGHHGAAGPQRGAQDHRTLRQLQWSRAGARAVTSIGNAGEVARGAKRLLRPDPYAANRTTVTHTQFVEYFKFAVVRNPWARAYSWYRNVLPDPGHRANLGLPPAGDIGFGDFLGRFAGTGLIRPQPYWLDDFGGRSGVDFVCRFENLERDYAEVCRRASLPDVALPHLNPGADSDYLQAYDDRSRRLVARVYGSEIEEFGYTFTDRPGARPLR